MNWTANCEEPEFTLYKQESGPFKVVTVRSIPVLDAARGKEIPVRVTYPGSGHGHPVIVWSHGAFGSKDGYKPLIRHWASHGYVCVQPTHADSVAFGVKIGDWAALDDWRGRVADVIAVLDALPDLLQERIPELAHGRADLTKIGGGGHSYGSHTMMFVAGARYGGEETSPYNESRPRAFVLLSPAGIGNHFKPGAWTGLARPLLVLTGTEDSSIRTGADYTWRFDVFEQSPPGDKYLAVIKGGHHGFGGISGVSWPGAGPAKPEHVRYTQSLTLAFWDEFLRHLPAAAQFLQEPSVAAGSAGAVTLRQR